MTDRPRSFVNQEALENFLRDRMGQRGMWDSMALFREALGNARSAARREAIEDVQSALQDHDLQEGDGWASCMCGKWDEVKQGIDYDEHLFGVIDDLAGGGE